MGTTHSVKNQPDKWRDDSSGSGCKHRKFHLSPTWISLFIVTVLLLCPHLVSSCSSLIGYKTWHVCLSWVNINIVPFKALITAWICKYTLGMCTRLRYAVWPLDGVIILRIAWPAFAALIVAQIKYWNSPWTHLCNSCYFDLDLQGSGA